MTRRDQPIPLRRVAHAQGLRLRPWIPPRRTSLVRGTLRLPLSNRSAFRRGVSAVEER